MSSIQESVDVQVPVSVAYNQWTQFEAFPQFMEGVESITQIDDDPQPLGGRDRGRRAGVRRRDHRAAPGRAGRLDSVDGERQHAGVVTFHRLGDDRRPA